MAKKAVDRASIDLVRAGVSAHHAHRWIKDLQRSLSGPEPDWQAYRNALAYLTLTEKHLTDWMSRVSEGTENGHTMAEKPRPGPRAVPGAAKGGVAAAKAGKGPRGAKRKAATGQGRTRSGKRSAAGSNGAYARTARGKAILQAAIA